MTTIREALVQARAWIIAEGPETPPELNGAWLTLMGKIDAALYQPPLDSAGLREILCDEWNKRIGVNTPQDEISWEAFEAALAAMARVQERLQ